MQIPVYHVDAFTSRVFGGNPAAVCPLENSVPDDVLQSIAAEHNLSETAFLWPIEPGRYQLRWFTPEVEVDLCGHATLASAYVVFEKLLPQLQEVAFDTASGRLTVKKQGDRLSMDFPSRAPTPCDPPADLLAGLRVRPQAVLTSRDFLAVYSSEAEVRSLAPDMSALKRLRSLGVIVTAPGDDVDFVSRFFAPQAGVDEDPVTGSAHCTLTPYWSARLGRAALRARQVSRRGGELWCTDQGDRVAIAGHAVMFSQGMILL